MTGCFTSRYPACDADAIALAVNAGELKEYVVEEVNVRSLKTCGDPLHYCTLRAEPDYPSLGKRLGKGMAKVGKAVKGMTTHQILEFEAQGRIELEGESLESGEIRVGCASCAVTFLALS